MYVCKTQVEVCSYKLGDNTELQPSVRQTQRNLESQSYIKLMKVLADM